MKGSAVMILSRSTGILFAVSLVGLSGLVGFACSGNDGKDGAAGALGAAGVAGPQGPSGAPGAVGPAGDGGAGAVLSGACTTPCHTFNGVVDQWRFSNHSHPQENEIGGGVCGNCHGVDGIEQRVGGNYVLSADAGTLPTNVAQGHINYKNVSGSSTEITYAGASTIGRIHCATCHEFNSTTDPHVTGKYTERQAPIRVAGGANDVAYIEKTLADAGGAVVGQSVGYKTANVCIFCHKSRKDISLYITANNNLSRNWGPHEGPQADIFTGKGGYEFAGKSYGTAVHTTIANGCVDCHMQAVAANSNVPDHTMKPKVAYCKTCHTTYTGTDFNIDSGRTIVKGLLTELQQLLDERGLLTRTPAAPYQNLTDEEKADGQFHLDKARKPAGTVDADLAGALYNYLLAARGKDLGVHNPRYTKQLLFDSIVKLGTPGDGGTYTPKTLTIRPN